MSPAAIRRLGIANRGEAAMRCIRAVKALRAEEGSDLQAIALYTDVDRDAPFVRHADVAERLDSRHGELAAYLDHELLVNALRRARADAVWPGWGFVAEDPAFVERLQAAGIRFLGPNADTMRQLGDKISAKSIAEAAGVPVTPWSGAALANEREATDAAERLGYPVVVKAAAGGGGRGIRMVERREELAAAFRSAGSEAASAFGDARLFIERRVSGGRHVEVQIAGDASGALRALGCRDCSVQRRHQKLLEEAPPPGLAPGMLDRLQSAAVCIAERVGYAGVGTVEFLVAGDAFYFLEMNPRLQVEHGVTEAITGLDLVQLQIRIARGESIAALRVAERGVAIEARVCAEDPDAGFQPAPGTIARFDPALGPRLRVDTGVAAGSVVPPFFDSLVAKVIASGDNREEARARLSCALADFDIVIAGGATNKGFLLDVLDAPDYRAGGVDTTWLDRFVAGRPSGREYAVEALVAAAILTYQRNRHAARLNFYADASSISADRVPSSQGQQIDLTQAGASYRLEVFAVGSWRYCVHLDGRTVAASLREESAHAARLEIGERTLRVLYDATDSGLRVEVEGHPHRFGGKAAGEVRAGAPAVVVAIHVEPGQRVEAGQVLGVLEAMKMEIGFEAPISGVVDELRARPGRQVAAGDVLLVIDPGASAPVSSAASQRLQLFDLPDPLEPLFARQSAGELSAPALAAADAAQPEARDCALDAVREEVRRVLLGYDAHPDRTELLASFIGAPLPEGLSEGFRWQLAEIRRELAVFADAEQLFIRSPSASVGGDLGPSNSARLGMLVRRLHASGAGISGEFLALARGALAHYGIHALDPSDALERAVLRLLATRHSAPLRHRLVLAVLRRVTELARCGIHLGDDRVLEGALGRIAGMRGLVSDAVADGAAEAAYLIFERPRIERLAERTSKRLERWWSAAESEPSEPPEEVLRHLADAPRSAFNRVGRWLGDPDPRRRAIARAAYVRRLYSPEIPLSHHSSLEDHGLERLEFAGGRRVLGATCPPERLAETAAGLIRTAAAERDAGRSTPDELEIIVPVTEGQDLDALVEPLRALRAPGPELLRATVSAIRPSGDAEHRSFAFSADGARQLPGQHGLHPVTARRIELGRLAEFELERIPAGDGVICFYGRSRTVRADERIFVLADVRGGQSPDEGRDAALQLPAFEHSFYEATRALRSILGVRDPGRRLHWNRIALFVANEVFLDGQLVQKLARRLAPATRHLGLEKVVVRLHVLDRRAPGRPAQPVEFVISDITGSNMEIRRRDPHTERLQPCSDYERKVVEARRRGLVYPYEIVRMLTGSGSGPAPALGSGGVSLPVGTFEEYELDSGAARPVALSAAGRPFGKNRAAIVFGVINTPTDRIPEGMQRVLMLSDPTMGMGSLAGAECDRIVAAIDLADRLSLPLEWIPVSSGARISMESGTENLDATARVVRRIVQFTQSGGSIHIIVHGVNVGAQSYFNALATMLPHTRGALIMTPQGSMVLTGRAALEASGAVSAEDEVAIGGFERIMGPNGEAQYFARDLADAYRILYEHYRYTYVVPGECAPRRSETSDPEDRSICDFPCRAEDGEGFRSVGEIFHDATNPGRRRPFPMRAVMEAVTDRDGGFLERWRSMVGAETAIVGDALVGGFPVCLVGIESRNTPRQGYRPLDGPQSWTAGTLFPLSSKKVARAINAASGNRPVVVLANLSGFDGSPESMRKLQLEYGAEIARAVVNFEGSILFLVVSRYHGGAYVVFSQALNPGLRASALEGSFASVIGGAPAASVVFARQVRSRALSDPRVAALERELRARPGAEAREKFEGALAEAILEQQRQVAAEFDAIHSVERARDVGSLGELVEPARTRPFLIRALRSGGAGGEA